MVSVRCQDVEKIIEAEGEVKHPCRFLTCCLSHRPNKQTNKQSKQGAVLIADTRQGPTNRTLLMVTSLLSSVPSLTGDASLPFWKSFDPQNCLGIMRLQTIFHFLSTPWGKAKHRALTHWRPGEEGAFHYPSYYIRNL